MEKGFNAPNPFAELTEKRLDNRMVSQTGCDIRARGKGDGGKLSPQVGVWGTMIRDYQV